MESSRTIPAAAILFDTTLRDGEQAPGVCLTAAEKVRYVELAEAAGIQYLEIGFPQNQLDRHACCAAAEAVQRSRIVAMALTTQEGVSLAAEVGAHEVLLLVPSSTSHLSAIIGCSYQVFAQRLLDAVMMAHDAGLDVNIGLEDASYGDRELLSRLLGDLESVGDLITCVTVPDTRGCLLPQETVELLSYIRKRLPSTSCKLAFHAHNDLGLATANTLAALTMDPPVDCVHATACGFGERAGNASLEQVAVLLEEKLRVRSGIRLDHLYELCAYTSQIFATPIPAHAPIIGAKVFLHESGVHQKAMLRDVGSYQYLNPERLGRQTGFVLGKHSGASLREAVASASGTSEEEVQRRQASIAGSVNPSQKRTAMEKLARLLDEAFVGEIVDIPPNLRT